MALRYRPSGVKSLPRCDERNSRRDRSQRLSWGVQRDFFVVFFPIGWVVFCGCDWGVLLSDAGEVIGFGLAKCFTRSHHARNCSCSFFVAREARGINPSLSTSSSLVCGSRTM